MIAVLINSLTSGGAERIALTLIDQFVKQDQQVNLYLIEKEQFYELPDKASTYYLTDHESLDNSILQLPFLIIGAWRLKQQINRDGVAVVQSHLPRANCTNILAKLMGAKHQAQLIIHSSTNYDSKSWWYRILAKWLMRQIFNRADSLVFISEVMKRQLNNYFNLSYPQKQSVIYNPHILEELRQKAHQSTPNFQFNISKRYLVFAGRLVALKRVRDIITAFDIVSARMPALELLIIGEGEEQLNLEELVAGLSSSKQIHFLGYQSNPYPFIAQSDALILASDREGLPNILIESMACGTPVISSDCISGPREILNPQSNLDLQLKEAIEVTDCGILFPIGVVPLLAEAIRQLFRDPLRYQQMVEQGRKRAEDFDARVISPQYFEALG